MDLQKKTELELLDMRMEINKALESYKDRGKTKVFTVFEEFEGFKYFLKKENAWKHILYLKSIDLGFDEKIILDKKFLTDSEIKKWCEDN